MSKRPHRRTAKPKTSRPPERSTLERLIGPAAAKAAGFASHADGGARPFWETKALDDMSAEEWESLCDGCGQCCLLKVEDEDTGDVYLTRLTCKLLDVGRCRCKDYANRHDLMPDCLTLAPENVGSIAWLPESCAYRRVAEGRSLAWWHPLISGDPDTVHQAGVSVRDWAVGEDPARVANIQHFIIGEVG